MELKVVFCFTLLAVAIISTEATGLSNTNTATAPEVSTSNLNVGSVANLRSKRQFYGGGFSGANAVAQASSGSFGGGFPFGGSQSFASANAASGAFGK